jgi:hypothetical protein
MHILPPSTPPTGDLNVFLDLLASRLGMLKRRGIKDTHRAATWFVKWWRDEGGRLSASAPDPAALPVGQRMGWGFDFEWSVGKTDVLTEETVQLKMEECIDASTKAMEEEEKDGSTVSSSQEKKLGKQVEAARRSLKLKVKLAARGR